MLVVLFLLQKLYVVNTYWEFKDGNFSVIPISIVFQVLATP